MSTYTYKYLAFIQRVVDGDTIVVDLDLGYGLMMKGFKIRYARINAPEMNTDEGKVVKDMLEEMLYSGDILVESISGKKDKWGRYLCEVYFSKGDVWVNSGDELIESGLVPLYKGSLLEEFIY